MKNLKKVQILPFRRKNKKIEFLILKRKGTRETWWQGITGGVEPLDNSLQKSAVRELKEEIGFETNSQNIIGPIGKFIFITNRKGYIGQTAEEYIFTCQLPEVFLPALSQEHLEYKWLSIKSAVKLIKFKESKDAIQKIYKMFSA